MVPGDFNVFGRRDAGVWFIGEKPIAGMPMPRMYRLSVPPGKICGFTCSPSSSSASLNATQ